jgi:hypothetical protein
VASTSASRGHSVRCAYKASIAASVRPANARSKYVDMTDFARRQIGGYPLGRRQGGTRRRRCPRASVPGPCRRRPGRNRGSAAMARSKASNRARVERQPQIAALNVGIPRGGRGSGHGKIMSVSQHDGFPLNCSMDTIRCC